MTSVKKCKSERSNESQFSIRNVTTNHMTTIPIDILAIPGDKMADSSLFAIPTTGFINSAENHLVLRTVISIISFGDTLEFEQMILANIVLSNCRFQLNRRLFLFV
ncbi:hypothetical protein GJ496_007258 [Pomphorhynchus laevis]|nr:hypothetical protein GJ496_007258 [Pomphorhynchus laevis]